MPSPESVQIRSNLLAFKAAQGQGAPVPLSEQRASFDVLLETYVGHPIPLPEGTRVESVDVDGIPAAWIYPPVAEKENDMASTTTRPTSRKGFALRKLVWVGPLTIIVAVLVNLAIRTIAVAFFGVPDGFTYLQAPFVIGSTVVFLLLALVAFILVGRFARRPVGFYRILALVALIVSFLNPIVLLAGLYPAPGMNLHIFWTMIVMHTVTAIITVSLLTTLAVEP